MIKKIGLIVVLVAIGFSFNSYNRANYKIVKDKPLTTLNVRCTYYYTPIIRVMDYGVGNSITVHKGRKDYLLYISSADEQALKTEGTGKLICNTETLRGTFLINSDYTIVPYTMDSNGGRLSSNAIAVDNSIIPKGTKVIMNNQTFIASDVGGAIKENHIDRFMGVMSVSEFNHAIKNRPETVEIKF